MSINHTWARGLCLGSLGCKGINPLAPELLSPETTVWLNTPERADALLDAHLDD